ncbi:hypothetical protein NOC27_3199 [Nitrosococcus oceani AFC27]|nr:hypothetical protein NOC27_3199 [Nitrosococcus oceani AFC27]
MIKNSNQDDLTFGTRLDLPIADTLCLQANCRIRLKSR